MRENSGSGGTAPAAAPAVLGRCQRPGRPCPRPAAQDRATGCGLGQPRAGGTGPGSSPPPQLRVPVPAGRGFPQGPGRLHSPPPGRTRLAGAAPTARPRQPPGRRRPGPAREPRRKSGDRLRHHHHPRLGTGSPSGPRSSGRARLAAAAAPSHPVAALAPPPGASWPSTHRRPSSPDTPGRAAQPLQPSAPPPAGAAAAPRRGAVRPGAPGPPPRHPLTRTRGGRHLAPLPPEPRPPPHVSATREAHFRGYGGATRAGALRAGRGRAGRGGGTESSVVHVGRFRSCVARAGRTAGDRAGAAGAGTDPPAGEQRWGEQPQQALRGALKHQHTLKRLTAHKTRTQFIGVTGDLLRAAGRGAAGAAAAAPRLPAVAGTDPDAVHAFAGAASPCPA